MTSDGLNLLITMLNFHHRLKHLNLPYQVLVHLINPNLQFSKHEKVIH